MSFLSDYRVLDLTDARGLMAGYLFAKFGADVVQVEPLEGSPARREPPLGPHGQSFFWASYAAGKRSLALDFEAAEARGTLLRLVEKADFLFESANSDQSPFPGISRDELLEANPRLVHVSVTPFGSDGPRAAWQATDLSLWAAGGALGATRDIRGVPLGFSIPQAWLHASADAACGALVAHFARLQTGRGQHVDISAQASVTQSTLGMFLALPLGHLGFDFNPVAKPGRKKTLDLSGSGARTRKSKWRVKDGMAELHLGIGPAAGPVANVIYEWIRTSGALPDHLLEWDWVTVPQRLEAGEITEADVDEARNVVAPFLAQFDRRTLMYEALRRRVPIGPVNEVNDLLESEHLEARGSLTSVATDDGPVILPWSVAICSENMQSEPRAAPGLGEHSREILSDWLSAAPAVTTA